jgi:hypothetical protein
MWMLQVLSANTGGKKCSTSSQGGRWESSKVYSKKLTTLMCSPGKCLPPGITWDSGSRSPGIRAYILVSFSLSSPLFPLLTPNHWGLQRTCLGRGWESCLVWSSSIFSCGTDPNQLRKLLSGHSFSCLLLSNHVTIDRKQFAVKIIVKV